MGHRPGSLTPSPDDDASPRDRIRRLAQTHYAEIWALLRRLGVRPEGVDDAAQHVFLIAAAKPEQIAFDSERAFLVSVAVRTAANRRRAQGAHRARIAGDEVAHVPSGEPQADELVEQKRLRALLDEALDTMPLDLRDVFVLFELEGLTLDEIAVALQLARGTAASRLRRAREAFHAATKRLRARQRFQGERS